MLRKPSVEPCAAYDKLKSFDDVDEFGAKSGSLNTHNIQEALCEGKDVFNVIPRVSGARVFVCF